MIHITRFAGTILTLTMLIVSLTGTAAMAQNREDRGFVTQILEDLLSREDSEVGIFGLSGVASGPVTIERVSVTDQLGEWLIIENLEIDWDRGALFGGDILFRSVGAETVTFRRWAEPEDKGLPSAEASGFKLPELPLRFRISDLAFPQILFSGPSFDERVEVELGGSADLARGKGALTLDLARIDDRTDRIDAELSYDETTELLEMSFLVREAAGGVVSQLLGLPGAPSIDLTLVGDGTFDDFNATLDLMTNDVERLSGDFGLVEVSDGSTAFELNLSGDIRPLFEPDYRNLFGENSELSVVGNRAPNGALDLPELSVSTAEMTLEGRANLASDLIPTSFFVQGRIGSLNGEPVLLPLPGPSLTVGSARLEASFDSALSDNWFLEADLEDYKRDDGKLDLIVVSANGLISDDPEDTSVSLDAVVDISGLGLANENLARALGPDSRTEVIMSWDEGSMLQIDGLEFAGDHVNADFSGEIRPEDRSLTLAGGGSISSDDLAHFVWPEQRSVSGRAILAFVGDLDVLGGETDAEFDLIVQDLRTGLINVDRMLGTELVANTVLRRDVDGTAVDIFEVDASGVQVEADGRFGGGRGQANFTSKIVRLADLIPDSSGLDTSGVFPALNGALDANGRLVERPDAGWDASVTLQGTHGLSASAIGVLRTKSSSLDIAASLPVLPNLPTPLNTGVSVQGAVSEDETGWSIDAWAKGPGPVESKIEALVADGGQGASVRLTGHTPLGILDAAIAPNMVSGVAEFEASTDDPASLAALSGQLSIRGATVAITDLSETLQNVDLVARLEEGGIRLEGLAKSQSGGLVQLNGGAGLQERVPLDLTLGVESYTLRRPDVFSSRVDGTLYLKGDLNGRKQLSGTMTVGETLVQLVPSMLSSVPSAPKIKHLNEPREVRMARERARIPDSDGTSRIGPEIDLDVKVTAPGTVRVIGPSLVATLGGDVRLTGTTANIRQDGRIGLIDGRLSIIGRRLDLVSGNVWLEGNTVPRVEFVAFGESRDISLHTVISGPVDEVNVDFMSRPKTRLMFDESYRPAGRSRVNFDPGRILTDDEAVSAFFLGNPGNAVSPLQVLQLLYGARAFSQATAVNLDKARSTHFDEGERSDSPSKGLAPSATPRPVERDVLLRVLSDLEGETEVVLELEVTNDFSIIGRTESDGNSAIGLFFARDY